VAWDDDRQAFKIKNSWGDSWGAKGFCWYPYSYEFVEGWACTPDIAEDRKPPVIEIPFFFRWLGW
jgi:C1A family cysteine protease